MLLLSIDHVDSELNKMQAELEGLAKLEVFLLREDRQPIYSVKVPVVNQVWDQNTRAFQST